MYATHLAQIRVGTRWRHSHAAAAFSSWVDLAAYGTPKVVRNGGDFDPKATVRKFEHWTRDVGGWAPYYTDIFCTRREYKQMFDHSLWELARDRLGASDAFPEPFDKVKSEPGIVDLADIEADEAAEEAAVVPARRRTKSPKRAK